MLIILSREDVRFYTPVDFQEWRALEMHRPLHVSTLQYFLIIPVEGSTAALVI